MQYQYQREGWFLDAASMYCKAVQSLVDALGNAPLGSRALCAFRAFLASYVVSAEFELLIADTRDRKDALAQIRYCTRIRGLRSGRLQRRGPGDVRPIQAGGRQRLSSQVPRLAGNEPRGRADPGAGCAAVP
jgi:hypothetical protein